MPESTDYDAYRLHCCLTLASGREVSVERLHQSQTYRGLLEGVPNSSYCDRNLEWTLKDARKLCLEGDAPTLITPARRDFLRVPGDTSKLGFPHAAPEYLPQVTCVAQLYSIRPARDRSKDGSLLTVVWYQDQFAPPIQEPALSSILHLDWDRLASDFEW
jgi:hypothetical protein